MTDNIINTGRRDALKEYLSKARSTNPSLWLDKYYKAAQGEEVANSKKRLIEETIAIGCSPQYFDFYEGWQQLVKQQTQTLAIAEVLGRMAVGLGNKGVIEAGISLHQTYGVPFIPGSALKGLTAAYAYKYVLGFNKERENSSTELTPYEVIFGTSDSSGYLTFFDALYIPDSAQRPLDLDIITAHHTDYYVGNEPKAPADWDSPIPAPFLTAKGRYLIAIGGEPAWANIALHILGCALRDLGIGAKTSAGYGRMKLLDLEKKPIDLPIYQKMQGPEHNSDEIISSNEESSLPKEMIDLLARLESLPPRNVASEINKFVNEWRTIQAETPIKQKIAQAIVQKIHQAGREKASNSKDWYQELISELNTNK